MSLLIRLAGALRDSQASYRGTIFCLDGDTPSLSLVPQTDPKKPRKKKLLTIMAQKFKQRHDRESGSSTTRQFVFSRVRRRFEGCAGWEREG